jgi:hypothetical protein
MRFADIHTRATKRNALESTPAIANRMESYRPSSRRPLAEAWRIQAAALAAEQIALTEWEENLHNQQAELKHEETEISARLEEKHHQVIGLQEQLSQGREQLRQERDQLAQQEQALETARQQAIAEREEFEREQGSLEKRWNKCIGVLKQKTNRWKEYRDRSTAKLQAKWAELEKHRQQARTAAEEEAARLQQAWQKLEEERARFQAEQQQARDVAREQENARKKLAGELNDEQRQWRRERKELERQCKELRAEAAKLEVRIAKARQLPGNHSDARDAQAEQPRTLADYRLHLAQMYGQLAHQEEDWQSRQLEAVVELESLAVQLQEEETHLTDLRRELELQAEQLRREQAAMYRVRRDFEQRSAAWSVRELQWQAEQERTRAEWRGRERQIHQREVALADLVRRTQQRRRAEIAQIHDIVRANEKMHQHWAKQVQEYHGRCQSVREAQQAHAEQVLALEQARAEFLDRADDPTAGAKRIERLRRRWQGLSARPLREANQKWKALETEQERWAETLAHFRQELEALVQRERDLAEREMDAEAFRLRLDEQAEGQEQVQLRWQELESSYQQQLAALREELGRIVGDDLAGPQLSGESIAA